jgi:hypothetical protein
MEAQYRSLAEQYVKLAECEEDARQENQSIGGIARPLV